MLKRAFAVIVALTLLLSLFTGCVGDKGSETSSSLNLIEGPEPETIDPALNSSVDGGTYILHFFEGLTRIDKDENVVPGVAEKWDILEGGTKYVFHLRDNIKWSDGEPVKAQDYEYAWKRALDPKTASPYASILYYIKNAEEFNTGKAKVEDVGIKTTDDKTIEVTLKAPTSYMLKLMGFPTYMPVRKDIIEKYGDKWTQSAESYVTNGAYKLQEWKHKDVLEMVKNDNYWDKENIHIQKINWKLVEDDNAALNAYDSGEVDAILNNHIPVDEVQNLINEGKAKVYPMLGTYYIEFSIKNKPVDNVKLRKALSLAIDRQQLVDTVTKAGQKPATGLVPYGTTSAVEGKDFRNDGEGINFFEPTAKVDAAKKLLAEAGYPDGKGVPPIEIVYNTNTSHQKVMEFLQEQWKKNLGIDVKISNMEWKTLIPKRQKHDFIITRSGWFADFNDPMSFLSIFVTGDGNNNPGYDNPQYNALIKKAQLSGDQKERMKAMHEAEKLLMDDMPAVPLYFYVIYQMENPKLKGMITSKLGFNYLHYATIE